jgi:hypothetical protein
MFGEQLRGQHRRAARRHRLSVQRHLAAGVAHVRVQVMAVRLGQAFADDQPQPEE